MPLHGGFRLDLFEVLRARLLELSGGTASFPSLPLNAFLQMFSLIVVQERSDRSNRFFLCHLFTENEFVSCAVDLVS